ncbi:MAG: hypothetical protein HQ486_01230 [Acidimicrobiaceae bacterium]|nr:hypothetical protein [Acidimicrobiaceae bacterium]
MAATNEDYDALLTELLADTNNMRDKYDEFSQFMEIKIAEFVLERKLLAPSLGQLTRDLAVTNAQRSQIQAELVKLTNEVERLKLLVETLTTQRNNAKNRVLEYESTRLYRLSNRLSRFIRRSLQSK